MVARTTKSDGRSSSLLYLLGTHIPTPSSDRARIRITEARETTRDATTRIFTRTEKEIIKRVCESKNASPEEIAEWSNCSVETIRAILKQENFYRWRQRKVNGRQ